MDAHAAMDNGLALDGGQVAKKQMIEDGAGYSNDINPHPE